MTLDETADALNALGNPTRLSIYRLLVRAGEGGLSVGAIQGALDVPGSTLTHHLKHLMSVGLIHQERQGTTLLCRADYGRMNAVLGFLTAECCVGVRSDAITESTGT